VGQILEVDSDKAQLGESVADGAPVAGTNPHNLEVRCVLCAVRCGSERGMRLHVHS